MTYADNGDIVLNGKGTGGLTEMRAQLNANQVNFGVIRVRAVDDHGSKRAKFVFITFVGAGVVTLAGSKVGCLLRLEPNLERALWRVTVRGTDDCICLLVTFLILATSAVLAEMLKYRLSSSTKGK